MKDIYDADLEVRIHDFLDRKTRKYPELRLFEQQSDIAGHIKRRQSAQPPNVILHNI